MFYSSALARVECVCGSKVMSSLTSPTSHTNSVKINSEQNLVCLTKKSFFDLSLTALTFVPDVLWGYKNCFLHTEVRTRDAVEGFHYHNL